MERWGTSPSSRIGLLSTPATVCVYAEQPIIPAPKQNGGTGDPQHSVSAPTKQTKAGGKGGAKMRPTDSRAQFDIS
jgi:hypothetical protein